MAPSALEPNYDASKAKTAAPILLEGKEDHDLVLRTFRLLIADLVQNYKGGHPG